MKHLLSLEKLPGADIEKILRDAVVFKRERARLDRKPLAGQTWALIFSKSSTRTRVSFEVGIRELGGQTMFLNANDIQLGRGEPIKDTARVLGRMIHGAVIRTFAQSDVEEFAEFSKIPTINALTDDEHPCQILADIFTFKEKRGPIAGKVVTFIGDGACNVARSWIFAAAKFGFELRIAAPKKFQPSAEILKRAGFAIALRPAAGKIVAPRFEGRRERRGPALHRCLGFDGQGSRSRRAPENAGRLSNQPEAREAGQAGRAGDALSAGVSRQGN